jgi:hypothetical protein
MDKDPLAQLVRQHASATWNSMTNDEKVALVDALNKLRYCTLPGLQGLTVERLQKDPFNLAEGLAQGLVKELQVSTPGEV